MQPRPLSQRMLSMNAPTYFTAEAPWSTGPRYTANRQVIEGRDRIGLRPQPHPTGLEPRVAVVEIQLAVEPRLYMVTEGSHAHRVPLAERRGLHARTRELAAPAVV